MNDPIQVELNQIFANGPYELLKSQKALEQHTINYVEARELRDQALYEYNKAYAESIEKLKGEGKQVTIVRELAKGECIDLDLAYNKCETMVKKFSNFMDVSVSKINAIKTILKKDVGKYE